MDDFNFKNIKSAAIVIFGFVFAIIAIFYSEKLYGGINDKVNEVKGNVSKKVNNIVNKDNEHIVSYKLQSSLIDSTKDRSNLLVDKDGKILSKYVNEYNGLQDVIISVVASYDIKLGPSSYYLLSTDGNVYFYDSSKDPEYGGEGDSITRVEMPGKINDIKRILVGGECSNTPYMLFYSDEGIYNSNGELVNLDNISLSTVSSCYNGDKVNNKGELSNIKMYYDKTLRIDDKVIKDSDTGNNIEVSYTVFLVEDKKEVLYIISKDKLYKMDSFNEMVKSICNVKKDKFGGSYFSNSLKIGTDDEKDYYFQVK